jgi:DNA-binding response OmpR family regulator
MHNKKRVLVVEDNSNMGFLLKEYLGDNGFEVLLCVDGDSGLSKFLEQPVDLCLIDVMLPGIDGFTLAERIRQANALVPVIFLTARSMKEDKIKGFNIGGDDYVTKPFDEEELLCRIHAVLNRYESQPPANPEEVASFEIGRYTFDVANQALLINNSTKRLTYRESDVLKLLCRSKEKVVRRSDILTSLWGNDDYFNGRSLDVFITRLRKHLSGDPLVKIETVPKVGFVLTVGKA